MRRVSSKITLYQNKIRELSKASVKALEKTAEALHTEIVQAQVIPRMDGTLQNESTFVDDSKAIKGHVSIVSNTPYARRLYFHPEYHFMQGPWQETVEHKDGTVSHLTHEGNPNAKGRWYEDWLSGGKNEKFAQKTFNELFKREAGL